MKVYIVEVDNYEESPRAVFSTEEKAIAWTEAHPTHYGWYIYDFEVDKEE